VRSLDAICLDHGAWIYKQPPPPGLTEDDWFTTEDDPDLSILLRAIENLSIPKSMDQGKWCTFCQRWQDTFRVDPSNTDAHLAILLANLPSLSNLILSTTETSCNGFVLGMLRELAGRKDISGKIPILRSLTHLRVWNSGPDTVNSHLAAQLLTIPTLTHFWGNAWRT